MVVVVTVMDVVMTIADDTSVGGFQLLAKHPLSFSLLKNSSFVRDGNVPKCTSYFLSI